MFADSNDEELQDFGALLDSYYEGEQLQRGDIREAEILQIDASQVVVDLGVKRDGLVPPTDLERLDPAVLRSLRVGDIVPVYVLNPYDQDGNLIVSLNLGLQGQDWTRAQQLLESGDLVEAEVIGQNKGGVLVRFGRLEGFVPNSHCTDLPQGLSPEQRQEAVRGLIGKQLGLKVIEVNQRRRRLILSQREAQQEWRTSQKQRLLQNLKVGDIVPGRVTGVRDFGVFVDIGGADGLVHVSELAWHRVPHPRDVVSIGDEVQVYVLELDEKQQRIALSLRRAQPDPWEHVEQRYQIDQVVQGTIGNVVDFGAFVVLDDGIEGLLHVTEMGDGTLTEPHSYVQRGDRVTVRIVRIEPERKRIGFTQQGLDMQGVVDEPDQPAPVEHIDAVQPASEIEAPVPSDEVEPDVVEDAGDEPAE